MKKTVAVTGAGGFLGTMLCERLIKEGYPVVGLLKGKNRKARPNVLKDMSIVYGDLRDYDTVRYMLGHYEVDTVYHLGAVTILKHSVTDPRTCYEINAMGTLNVLEAARQLKVRRVVAKSTDKSYGTHEILPYVEDMAVQASPDAYSTSKACMDLISQQYAMGYGMNLSIIRCGNAYGPDLNLSRLIPGSVMRILSGERPVLHDGVKDYAREFMYCEDVVDAYLTVAEKGLPGEAYNIGGAGRVTVYEVVKKIMEKLGMEGEPEIRPFEYKEIKDQWLDATKLKSLGWECKHNIDQGLDKTIEWYKKYKDACDFFRG